MGRLVLLVCLSLAALVVATLAVGALEQAGGDTNDLLINGGFEDRENGWTVLGGDLSIVEVAEAPHLVADGARAAQLDVGADQPVLRLFQHVPGSAGGTFQLSGLVFIADPGVEWARLEISWQSPGGGYGDAPSQQLNTTDGAYQQLVTAAGNVPCDATDARASIVVRRSSDAAQARAYVDALQLTSVGPPAACPTATPSPTLSPTATATPTRTETAVPTLTAAPSPTPTRTETSNRTPSPTRSATDTPTPAHTPTSTGTGTPPLSPTTAAATATHTQPGPILTTTPSHGMLVNGGFEVAEDGQPIGWRTFGGVLTQVSAPVRSGAAGACLASATPSTKWAFQVVAVDPDAWYLLEGYVLQTDPEVSATWLRISWYASGDGSGSALSTVDSLEELTEPEPDFRKLTTGPVRAPSAAHSASARIMLRPVSAAPAMICVDDVTFAATVPPSTVTPTASLAPSATPTATSPRPTPTASYTATGTPDRDADPEPEATLGASPTGTAARTSTPDVDRAPATATPTALQADAPLPPAGGLLVNGGFERLTDGELFGWSHYGGLLSRVNEPVHGGRSAGALFSSTASTKWAYQTIAVTQLQWYEMAAFVAHDHPGVETAWLRVSWYESADGTGSALTSVDSLTTLDAAEPGYRELGTGPVQAPPGVRSARVRIMLRPRSELSALIYIDDVSFRAVAAPPNPAGVTEPAGISQGAASLSSGRAGGGAVPDVLGVVATRAPQPTPVIRRNGDTLLVPEEVLSPGDSDGVRKWLWVIVAGLLAAGASGMAAYWRGWPATASRERV